MEKREENGVLSYKLEYSLMHFKKKKELFIDCLDPFQGKGKSAQKKFSLALFWSFSRAGQSLCHSLTSSDIGFSQRRFCKLSKSIVLHQQL